VEVAWVGAEVFNLITKPETDSGKAFALEDRAYDPADHGPLWLADDRIAGIVADALERGDREYHLYELFASVIMSNHVHVVFRPARPLLT